MDFKRILVAIDSLNDRDAAFARALVLARTSGAELYLLHAVPVNQRFSFRAAERLERMVEMRGRAQNAGVRVQTVEQHGDAAEIIALHANARAVDLIVMGGKARRGWRRRDRSFVTERVIRRTEVPTLVVASAAPDSPTAFRNVLVALDLSTASKDVLGAAIGLTAREAGQLTVMHPVAGVDAARAAVDRGRRHRTRMTLVHALKDVPRHMVFSGSEAWKLVRRLPAQVEAVAERLRQKAAFFGVDDVDTEVATGRADGAILEVATRNDADLVVMGLAHRSWFSRVLYGSTLRRVLREATVPVLVVPVVAGAHSWPAAPLGEQARSGRVWSEPAVERVAA